MNSLIEDGSTDIEALSKSCRDITAIAASNAAPTTPCKKGEEGAANDAVPCTHRDQMPTPTRPRAPDQPKRCLLSPSLFVVSTCRASSSRA